MLSVLFNSAEFVPPLFLLSLFFHTNKANHRETESALITIGDDLSLSSEDMAGLLTNLSSTSDEVVPSAGHTCTSPPVRESSGVGDGEQLCYIYVMKAADFYKIGFSHDPLGRLASLQSAASPHCITIVCQYAFRFSRAREVELQLHGNRLFAEHWRREWFILDPVVGVDLLSGFIEHLQSRSS